MTSFGVGTQTQTHRRTKHEPGIFTGGHTNPPWRSGSTFRQCCENVVKTKRNGGRPIPPIPLETLVVLALALKSVTHGAIIILFGEDCAYFWWQTCCSLGPRGHSPAAARFLGTVYHDQLCVLSHFWCISAPCPVKGEYQI